MAEVFIAAAPDADKQAGGLAQALKSLGYDAAAVAPSDSEIAKLVDDAKCVIGLWSRGAPTAELAMLAALAHERKKLVSAELVMTRRRRRLELRRVSIWRCGTGRRLRCGLRR